MENEFDDQLVILLVAPMPFVDADRRKLITHKWRTDAYIKCDVRCRVN
ncbi:hypothetical protein T11_388 [Trichinella zimbabwensis]|uniref:Uncharacterized protein n=1 Tax=Trichinella zimbabwensis TaxID=268475 RepID=A0A0V1GGP0_9BILA|nr:hypothetical protein T11_388 [Trichinella zimbabwensis]